MSSLSDSMKYLKNIFDKYAGDKGTLTKKELIEMFHTEIPETQHTSQGDCDEFFTMLDEDGDGAVDFKEFTSYIATVTMLYAMC